MDARSRARWFGAIDLLAAASLVALYEPLYPLLRAGGCMGSLGTFIVCATIASTLTICGITLLTRASVGAWLCFVVGAIALYWIGSGVLQSLAREASPFVSPLPKRLVQTGLMLLLPLQIVPGWFVLRAMRPQHAVAADA